MPTFHAGDNITISTTWKNIELAHGTSVNIIVLFAFHDGGVAYYEWQGKYYMYGVWIVDFAPSEGETSTASKGSIALVADTEVTWDAIVVIGKYKDLSDMVDTIYGRQIGIEMKVTPDGYIDLPAYFGDGEYWDVERFKSVMTVVSQ